MMLSRVGSLTVGFDAGVEEFFGQDPLVALDFAVVAWGVGPDAVVARCERCDGADEGGGTVVRPVVGHDAGDPADAVSGEKGAGPVEEADGSGGGLIGQMLGVGQPGEAIDDGVQVDVAALGAAVLLGFGAAGGPGGRATAAVGAPATAVSGSGRPS